MKEKVTFLTNLDPGGITTVLNHLFTSKEFKNKFDFSVFLFKHSEYSEMLDQMNDFVQIDNPKSQNKIINTIRLIKFLVSFDGNAVVCLGPIQVKFAEKIRKIFNKSYKIISWIHVSSIDPGIGNKINNLKYADYNLAISTGIKRELISLGISTSKIGLVYNPIQREVKTITESHPCKFIYIGRIVLDGQKNLRGLLECLSEIKGDWSIDIYGSGPDMLETEQIISSDKSLSKRVNLKGWSKNPFNEIENANALLLNSNYEGLPMVIAEGMSYGIPAIATNCKTGPEDLIKNGVNGYLYPVGDYKILSKYLKKFIKYEVNFNNKKIKDSIEFLYNDNYDQRFIYLLEKGINSRIKD
ncbi:glycosyltransferase [Fructilactobacillus frigidiflavus]|uniref:glycosyltransferase n=1 Tax=Fructilactobacillus frigidiflavus TaxID=3242688 RepID=UPI003756B601